MTVSKSTADYLRIRCQCAADAAALRASILTWWHADQPRPPRRLRAVTRLRQLWAELEKSAAAHGYDIFLLCADPRRGALATIKELRLVLLDLQAMAESVFYPDERLEVLSTALTDVLKDKGATYGDSWKKRGGVGAFMMLCRKWDRIENILSAELEGLTEMNSEKACEDLLQRNPGDVLDDVADLRGYFLLVDDEVNRLQWNPDVRVPTLVAESEASRGYVDQG